MNSSTSLKQTFASLILFFYVIFPLIFYGGPLLYTLIEGINFNVHWYVDFSINSESLTRLLLIHLFIGIGIYIVSKKILMQIEFNTSENYFFILLMIVCMLFQLTSVSYIKLIAFIFLIFLLSNMKIDSKVILIFLFFGLVSLFTIQDREMLVFSAILMSFILRLRLLSIIFLSMIGLFILVFILEPLKYGISPLDFFSLNNGFVYLFMHLQPIYVSSFFFLEYDDSFLNIFAEGIPLLKGMLETGSVYSAEIFSKYDAGINLDFGSNNSMYANLNGLVVCMILLLSLFFLSNFSNEFSISLLFYVCLMGPSFIRRSFGSYFIDLLILFLLVTSIFAFKELINLALRNKNKAV